MIRSWLAAVVWSRSRASVAQATAESKPKVKAVQPRSLSIVLGTPTTGMPCSCSCCAMASEPSPPMHTSPEMPSCRTVSPACRSNSGSIATRVPSPTSAENRPLFVEPRIVPPWSRMLAVFCRSSGM